VLGLIKQKGVKVVQPQTGLIPSRRGRAGSHSLEFRVPHNQPEPTSKRERDISELETTVCPVCKQLKLADQECQSAICQETRKKQSA